MNIPVKPDGSVAFEPPVSGPGDHITLRAEMDCVVAFSACRRMWCRSMASTAYPRRPTSGWCSRQPLTGVPDPVSASPLSLVQYPLSLRERVRVRACPRDCAASPLSQRERVRACPRLRPGARASLQYRQIVTRSPSSLYDALTSPSPRWERTHRTPPGRCRAPRSCRCPRAQGCGSSALSHSRNFG